MRLSAGGLVAVVLAAALGAASVDVRAAPSARTGIVTFDAGRSLWVLLDPRSGATRRAGIPRVRGADVSVRAADGQTYAQIAWDSGTSGPSTIWLTSLASGRSRTVGPLPGELSAPSLSPDGAAMSVSRSGLLDMRAPDALRDSTLGVVDLRTGAHTELLRYPAVPQYGGGPPVATDFVNTTAWSPDGARIAFVHDRIGFQGTQGPSFRRLEIIGPDGSDHRVLADNVDSSARPVAWSPDGRTLAFAATGPGRLETIDANGSGRRTLLTARGTSGPRWSPSGRHIAVVTVPGTTRLRLHVIDVRTGRATRIRRPYSLRRFGFAWSPAGDMLAICHRAGSEIIRPSGRRVRRLPSRFCEFQWAPGVY